MTASAASRGPLPRPWRVSGNCQEAGIKVGLRFTINKQNYKEITGIFDLLEDREIPRACFYHLVYAGRGSRLVEAALSHEETRGVVDLIIDRTADLFARGKPKEVLTVDNHARRPVHLPAAAAGRQSQGRGSPAPVADERRQQLGPGHRLRQLGWTGARGPVLAALCLRQCQRTAVQPDLDGFEQSSHGQAEGKEEIRHRPLRHLPLAGHLWRQFSGAGRGVDRRSVGARSGLLFDGCGNRLI